MEGNGRKTPFIIGVAGGTASGKSLVTQKIMEKLHKLEMKKQVVSLTLESFYREVSEEERKKMAIGEYDFDHPGAFEFSAIVDAVRSLQNGKSVNVSSYDHITNSKTGERVVSPADVIIVEGILAFYDERLRRLFDMKLFVDADADIRLARRVHRDTVEKRRPLDLVLHQYINKVKPSFEEFCLPTKKYADVVIPRGGENDVAIDLLVQHIQDLVRTPQGTPESSERGDVPKQQKSRPH